MKKLFLFFALFFTINAISFAQTKEETINWLKEKLEKCLVGGYAGWSRSGNEPWVPYSKIINIKLESIDACVIVISYSYYHLDRKEITSNDRATLPTSNLDIKEFKPEMDSRYYSFSYSAEVIKIDDLTKGETRFDSRIFGRIEIANKEEDIRSRIEKAIKHLATFCPQKKETF